VRDGIPAPPIGFSFTVQNIAKPIRKVELR
jgi:hypothetical protein